MRIITCSQSKLGVRPLPNKFSFESPSFLKEFKEIFVDLFTHKVVDFVIL